MHDQLEELVQTYAECKALVEALENPESRGISLKARPTYTIDEARKRATQAAHELADLALDMHEEGALIP